MLYLLLFNTYLYTYMCMWAKECWWIQKRALNFLDLDLWTALSCLECVLDISI